MDERKRSDTWRPLGIQNDAEKIGTFFGRLLMFLAFVVGPLYIVWYSITKS